MKKSVAKRQSRGLSACWLPRMEMRSMRPKASGVRTGALPAAARAANPALSWGGPGRSQCYRSRAAWAASSVAATRRSRGTWVRLRVRLQPLQPTPRAGRRRLRRREGLAFMLAPPPRPGRPSLRAVDASSLQHDAPGLRKPAVARGSGQHKRAVPTGCALWRDWHGERGPPPAAARVCPPPPAQACRFTRRPRREASPGKTQR